MTKGTGGRLDMLRLESSPIPTSRRLCELGELSPTLIVHHSSKEAGGVVKPSSFVDKLLDTRSRASHSVRPPAHSPFHQIDKRTAHEAGRGVSGEWRGGNMICLG